jgi:hypothetical protein
LGVGLPFAGSPARGAGTFDGTYSGPQKETNNDNSGVCQNLSRDRVQLSVTGDVAKYKWGVPVEATVAADGTFLSRTPGLSFHGKQNTVTFKGVIKGGALEADIGTQACAAHLSLMKK